MPIRAVVFDLFDTLVDLRMEDLPRIDLQGRRVRSTAGALHEALGPDPAVDLGTFAAALAEVDRAERAARFERGLEFPTLERFARLAERLGLDEPELPARLTEIHMARIAALVRTPAHHAAVLDALRGRARIGLCSNFSHAPAARAVLARAGLHDRLDASVISHEVGLRKPRREIFEAVLAALGSAPDETLHVGDDLAADVAGAAALGIRTAWITRRVSDPAAARALVPGASPDWIISDLEEIPAILENLS